MNTSTVNLKKSVDYIPHNKVVPQAFGELIEVANDQKNKKINVLKLETAGNLDMYSKYDALFHLYEIESHLCLPKEMAVVTFLDAA